MEKDRTDLQGQLEMRFLQIEAMEAQTDEIFKNHELAKEQLTIQKQEKIRLDAALKKTIQDIAKEHDLLLRTFREKENAIKLHIRLENQLQNIKNVKPKFEKQKEDLERELNYQQQENRFSRNNIRNARQEIDLIIYQYLQQEISDTNQKELLENNQLQISKLEGQLVQAQAEQHAANQQLYSVNIERDLKVTSNCRFWIPKKLM